MSTVKKMAAVMMSAVLLASSAACGEFAKTHELSKQSFIDEITGIRKNTGLGRRTIRPSNARTITPSS